MTAEENKAVARRWYGMHQPGRIGEAEAMCNEDFRAHLSGLPGPLDGREFKQIAAVLFTAFSEVEQTVEDQVAEGDHVASRGTWRARHTGEFEGIPATDRWVSMTWMGIDRIDNGKIAEHWAQFDMLTVLQQLGAVPLPAGVAQHLNPVAER
jgi:steroid delta-isomerase-like uncharacterized protein